MCTRVPGGWSHCTPAPEPRPGWYYRFRNGRYIRAVGRRDANWWWVRTAERGLTVLTREALGMGEAMWAGAVPEWVEESLTD